jgi:hypothetical protein
MLHLSHEIECDTARVVRSVDRTTPCRGCAAREPEVAIWYAILEITDRAATVYVAGVRGGDGVNVSISKQQREQLLGALKARFEKNMNRHKSLQWAQVQAELEAIDCGHSMKWKERAVNRTSLVTIKERANTFFAIVRRRALT